MAVNDAIESLSPKPHAVQRVAPVSAGAVIRRILLLLGILLFVVVAIFPVYYMIITTFKANDDLYNLAHFPLWFTDKPTFGHVQYLFQNTEFRRWLLNSYLIALGTVVITVLAAVPAGYALARLNLPGSGPLSIGIFLTYLVPPSLLFIPLSQVVSRLNLIDNIWALIVIYPTFTIPFCTWLMMGFFKTIPFDIEEAALIDGCNRIEAIRRVVLPLSRAGIFSVMMFAFTLALQEFIYALVFIHGKESKPVTLGVVTDLIRGDVFYWGELMAGGIIAGLPVAILYNFFLDDFIAGITAGSVK
ncbi:MAG: carbohydrate ABC transporter permease [Thermomicrobiales bacterium]